MSIHLTTFEGSVTEAIEKAIREAVADADIEVKGGGGHFTIMVKAAAFSGKSKIQSHRLVLGAIKHLMAGDNAPVHAIDRLETMTP